MGEKLVLRSPETIAELKQLCAYNVMQLERMRFFIGINYSQPRAFGIYREGDSFIVYKNKGDGSRAVHYCGPDKKSSIGAVRKAVG